MILDFDQLELDPAAAAPKEITTEEFLMDLGPVEDAPSAAVVVPEPAVAAASAPVALMEVLPAGFPLPSLIKFCPDPALRLAADTAAKYALSLEVREAEGVQRADVALTTLRASLKAIDGHFEEPADIANRLHKQITGTRAEWCAAAKAALDTVSRRVAVEQRRLQAEEQERRRRAQEEEDRKERERRRLEAEAAAKAQAPAPVVEELRRQAQTATAPPVAEAPATKLTGSSVVGTWKARPKGTSGADEPNPCIEQLTAPQKAQVMNLLRAIVDGEHPLVGIQVDWSYWNKRAKADKSTLDAPGIEAYEDLGLRGKSSRSK
jgi:hypothetical protein